MGNSTSFRAQSLVTPNTATIAHQGAAFKKSAEALADFTLARIVVRKDVFGVSTPEKRRTGHAELTKELLTRHYRGLENIGAHLISTDNRCLCLVADVDAHDDKADPEVNWQCVNLIVDTLKTYGLVPLVCDSNGKGGFHVRAFFKKPVAADVAYWLAQQIEGRLKAAGLPKVEIFPKQGEVNIDTPYGNWVRFPGKHPKREHYTRVYDFQAGRWLEGEAAVKALLGVAGDDVTELLAAFKVAQPAAEPKSKSKGRNNGQSGAAGEHQADEAEVRSALFHCPNNDLDYDAWIGRGFALNDWDPVRGLPIWIDWSRQSSKYVDGECERKWASMAPGGGVTMRTLFKRAYEAGWTWKPSAAAVLNAKSSSNGQHTTVDKRPEIVATHEEHDVNDLSIKALAGEPSIYQRNLKLVSVVFNSKSKSGSKTKIERPEGTPVIRAIQSPRLREVLSKIARWKKWVKNRKGGSDLVNAHPPDWSVNAIMAREDWPDVRYLAGVVEVPTLRADGSVIEKPGYDPSTGLLYVPSGKFPAVPECPNLDDADGAAEVLFDLVKDFPFKVKDNVSHRVAWLAALLTVLARFLVDGPTPIFLFEANTSGAGKTFLADLIALIATGRHMTRTGYYHDAIEMDKQIVATCLSGDLVVLFDNIDNGGNFGNSAIDRATTGRTYRGRILGKSEMTPDLDLNAVFFCSGNNISLCGDVVRRVIPCRLESDLEHPEERNDFTVKNLAGYTLEHRGELVCAALTVLKAFILAGMPDQGMVPMEFPEWSGLIRNAVKWVTGDDPAIGRKDLTDSDPERQQCAAFVEGWYEVQDANQSTGMTSADMLKLVKDDSAGLFRGIRNAMGEMWPKIKDGELPSSGSIGKKIHGIRGKVFGDKRFELAGEEKRAKIWKVVVIPKR
jgi:hypothetical protein